MNKTQKNIVVVGFTQEERNSLALPYLEHQTIHFVDSLKSISKYQGYLLLIDNKENLSIVEYDKKYRKSFNKYELIWIYSKKYESFTYKDKFSKIEKIGKEIFYDYSYNFQEDWDFYKFNKENNLVKPLKFNKEKEEQLNRLYAFIKNYKSIKTKQIVEKLGISERNVQRYMNDLNSIYHNIGYDYSLNEWYFIW